MIRKNKKSLPTKKLILIAVLLIIALGVIGSVIHIRNSNDKTQVVQQPGGPVTISPPTKQEQAESDARKDQIIQQQQAIDKSNSQTSTKQVTPVITYVNQNGLSSYVSGIFEDGGTCTATLSQGSESFQKTSSGYKDATTTGCSPIDFSASDFPTKGSWTATVSYTSATAAGTSKPVTFTVD